MNRFTLFVLSAVTLVLLASNTHAATRVDSLIAKLQFAPADTSRTRLLFDISSEYIHCNADSARIYAEKLIKHGAAINDKSADAKANYVFGYLHFSTKKFDSASVYYEKARELAIAANDNLIAGRALIGIGHIHRDAKQYDKALGYFLQAKSFLLKTKNALYVNNVYNNIGGMYTYKADLESELRVREELLKWNEQAKDTMYMAFTCNGIALLYNFKGLFKESVPWAEKAAKYFAAAGNFEFMANTYMTIGQAEVKLGHYDVAISKYLEGYGIAEKANSKESMANLLASIASIYSDLQDYPSAIEYYSRTIKLYDRIPNVDRVQVNRAIVHCALGDIDFLQKKYNEALSEYTIGLKAAEAVPNISITALCKMSIASVQNKHKEYQEALGNLWKSLELYRSVIENEGIGAVYATMAEVHFNLKNYDSTIYFGEKSIEFSNRTNIVKQLQFTYDIVSRAYNAKNNHKKAYQYLLIADQLKDSLLTLDKTRQIGHIEATYQIKRKLEKEKRDREARELIETEARERKNTIEYLGLLIFIFGSLVLVYFVRNTKVSAKAIEKYIFFIFLLFFQFVSMLLNDPIEMIAHGDQIIALVASLLIAIAITPIHESLHNFIVKRISRRKVNTKQYEKAIMSELQKSIEIPRKVPENESKVNGTSPSSKNDGDKV